MSLETKKFLSTITPFSILPDVELDRLSHFVFKRTVEPGEKVFAEGDKAHVTWVVQTGQMKITKMAFDGKPLTVEMIRPGEVFGCVGCIDSGFYPCEATASLTAVVIGIPTQDFLSLVERYPKFARGVYMEMGARVREAQNMRTLALHSVEKRIAGVLLWLRGKFGDTLPFTRQSIAEMANTTPESTIRTMIHLRKKGYIKTAWKKIILQKPDELKTLLEEIQ